MSAGRPVAARPAPGPDRFLTPPVVVRVIGPLVVLALVAAGCGGSEHKGASGGAPVGGHRPGVTAASPVLPRAVVAPWELGRARSRSVAGVVSGSVVLVGGLVQGDVSTASIVTIDPSTGAQTPAGSLPLAVHDAAGAVLGGEVYVFGGGAATTVANVQAWASGSAHRITLLSQPRSDLGAAVVGGTAYVVGGFSGAALLPDVLATTDGRGFRVAGSLAQGVRYPAVAAWRGAVWVIGGETEAREGSPAAPVDLIQRFDPSTGSATIVGRLPAPLSHAAAGVVGDTLFVFGGRRAGAATDGIWRVDPSGSASAAGRLPGPRSDAAVAALPDGSLLLLGGEVSGPADPLRSVVAVTAGG